MKKQESIDTVTTDLLTSDVDFHNTTTDNQLHYCGNPSTYYSISMVLLQDSRKNPQFYRGCCGITTVPITAQLSNLKAPDVLPGLELITSLLTIICLKLGFRIDILNGRNETTFLIDTEF